MRKHIVGLVVSQALLLVLFSSCGPIKPPQPPEPTPTPCVTCPAGQHCEGGVCVVDPPPPCPELGVPWCHETTPPMTCGQCKHQPAGERCPIMAPPCDVPPPVCPTCPAGQSCTDPAVGCVKDPVVPPVGACPWKLSSYPGAHLAANTKPWGNGFDHTTLVDGSRVYCLERGWTDGRSKCQVAQDGDPHKVPCEIEFGNGCARWEFRSGGVQRPCVDDQDDVMSCDHFGSTDYRDDPKTPTTGNTLATLQGFEGQPKQCGLQREGDKPIAGFFIIAHTTKGVPGEVRSCVDSSFSACGPFLPVKH